MYEEFDSFKNSTPSFLTENSRYHSDPLKKDGKENSGSVANCIRALTHKTTVLVKENNDLRCKVSQLTAEIQSGKGQLMEKTILVKNLESENLGYKEKCLVLEQSNEIYQKKIERFEENAALYLGLKNEMVLLNKELTKEIEKNQKLVLENNKLKDRTVCIQNSYQDLSEQFRKSTAKDPFDGYRVKGAEENLKLLEDLLEKQQCELQSKRNMVEVLKGKVAALEDTVFALKKENHKCELQMQEVTDMNEKLLRALKKKNHICRNRASTPDINTLPGFGHPSN